LFRAYETAPWETPQRRAISLMVTRDTTVHSSRAAGLSGRADGVYFTAWS
jgi:hypothetical protein